MKLFDLDGTLIDSNGIWVEVDLTFLGRRGLIPTEEYSHTVGHSIFPIAAQFTKDYYHLDMTTQEIMDEWEAMAREAYAHVPLKPGAAEFLARCEQEGHRMALVTACQPDCCRAALQQHGLGHYFEEIIFAIDLGMEKRHPDFFHLAAQQLGVSLTSCILYEDAPGNCVAAKAAGMQVVGVYDPFYEAYREEMARVCDWYIRDFTDLV